MKPWIGVVAGVVLLMGGRANGAVTVTGGMVELGPAAYNDVFLGGANIDAGKIVFNYVGGSSPAATIQSLLIDSYHGGLWDVGEFRSSTAIATGLTLGWLDDGSSAVTVMATYAGDFNLDGVVDSLDRSIWLRTPSPARHGNRVTSTMTAPFNGLDRDLLMANFGSPPLVSTSVPEPTTIVIWSLLGALAITVGRWRRRKAA